MIKAETKGKKITVEIQATTKDCIFELAYLMESLLDKTSIDEDDLAFAVALAASHHEMKQKSDKLRENFINNLFGE